LEQLAQKYNLSQGEDIRDCIVVPQDPEDWLFHVPMLRAKKFVQFMVVQTRRFGDKSYWDRVNTVEAISFATKISIIFPGLLLGKQWWWLYIFALLSSVVLVITSTIKTLPTIIWFNVLWIILASVSIIKHFA